MALFARSPSLDDMKLMCDIINDAASFAEPQIVTFPDIGPVIRMRMMPGVFGVFMHRDHRRFTQDVYVDETTGRRSDLQPLDPPAPVTDRRTDARQSAARIVYYVISYLSAAAEQQEHSKEVRDYATRALAQITTRMEQGPAVLDPGYRHAPTRPEKGPVPARSPP